MLRNFEAGHDFLREEFGITPKIAWQLDPFGHSSGFAALLAEMGFEATFFSRMNHEEAAALALERDLEFVWQPDFYDTDSSDTQNRKSIFAHKLYDKYGPPDFWANILDYSEGKLQFEYQDTFAANWFQHFDAQTKAYRTKNVLILYGNDFTHVHAENTYSVLNKIIDGL